MSYLIAIVIGAILIPLAAWRVVGTRRRRDPLLLPLLIVSLGFTVGGVATVLSAGGLDWKLLIGVLGLLAFARRWSALTHRSPAA